MATVSQRDKANVFRSLHERRGAFVIPNPWDAGSAKLLANLGFEALATTSSGFANTLGRFDGQVTLEEKLAHVSRLCEAVDIPVSADMENGFADTPEGVAETVLRVVEAGAVGCSIEDYTRDPANPIYDFELAVERIHAAVEAARTLEFPFVLTARSENFLWDRPDIDETISRLKAFEAAGAHVLYAPGISTLADVRSIVAEVSKPINVLAPFIPAASLGQLEAAGAKRVSVGGALYRAAMSGWMRIGRDVLDRGRFDWVNDLETLNL